MSVYRTIGSLVSENTVPFSTKFSMQAFMYMKMKIHKYDAGYMIKMAAMPIYGINT